MPAGGSIMHKAAAVLFLALSGCTQNGGGCVAPPSPATFALVANGSQASETEARERAERCMHYQAYRLASASDGAADVAEAVLGACRGVVENAQSSAYFAATASNVPAAPPPGFVTDDPPASAPPCVSGAAECKPWERAWNGKGPAPGSTVKERGSMTAADDEPSPAHFVGEELSRRALASLRSIAIFRVVEARAGKCRI